MTRPHPVLPCRLAGFTLVELIMVMVIMGVLAGSFMVFFKPAIDSYFSTRHRADLTDAADTALRRMMQEIKGAVPNSLNLVDGTTSSDGLACFQLAPTIGGGRYRTGPDIDNDVGLPCTPSATCSAFPDAARPATAATTLDALVQVGQPPGNGDIFVVNNQRPADYYGAAPASRHTVTATPTTPRATDGILRIALSGNPAANGYTAGRFQVVSQAAPSIMYSCANGRLYRNVLTTALAAACTTAGPVLATDVAACEFVYTANASATQESGFITLNLTLQRNGEAVTLSYGVHVDNLP